MEKRKYVVRSNESSAKKENAQLNEKCSTLEYVFVCRINTSLQVSKAQQLLSLSKSKWVSTIDVKESLAKETSHELKLDKKFKTVVDKMMKLQIEAIIQKGAVCHEEIFIVDANTPSTNSVQSLMGDDRLVIKKLQISPLFLFLMNGSQLLFMYVLARSKVPTAKS